MFNQMRDGFARSLIKSDATQILSKFPTPPPLPSCENPSKKRSIYYNFLQLGDTIANSVQILGAFGMGKHGSYGATNTNAQVPTAQIVDCAFSNT
jgi:hypothetical protein